MDRKPNTAAHTGMHCGNCKDDNAISQSKSTSDNTCPDCGVAVGQIHEICCDVEPCPECGRQLISCGCEAYNPERRVPWSGEWPGKAECREFGWYSKRNPDGPGYIRCNKDDPDASEDLNRLYEGEAEWDWELQRWVLKK